MKIADERTFFGIVVSAVLEITAYSAFSAHHRIHFKRMV